jgi:hypothetical protein
VFQELSIHNMLFLLPGRMARSTQPNRSTSAHRVSPQATVQDSCATSYADQMRRVHLRDWSARPASDIHRLGGFHVTSSSNYI